jgi:phosphate uptake regulator
VHNIDIHRFDRGTVIPRTSSSAKAGNTPGTETETDIRGQQAALDLEKKKLELEKERAALQSAIETQRAEADRNMLRATLERERMQATSTLEQVKLQGELFAKLVPQPAATPPEGTTRSDANAGYVTELVGYHALKRVSADITRGLSTVIGQGNDVRILIVDRLDYATGDIPFIEVTSQLSVSEVRCRKQVATNKELADLAMQTEEQGGDEKTPAVKTGATRLAPLAALPFFLPAITTAVSALPAVTGVVGTAADIAGYFRSDYSFKGRNLSLKTEGLIAAVAGSLKSEKRYVYVYNFYSMDTTGPQSKLMNMYAGVLDCSSRLAQSRNRLLYFISKKTGQLAELNLTLKKLDAGTPTAEGDQKIADLKEEIRRENVWLGRANMEVLASDAIHTELGIFVKIITTADAAQPASKLAQAVFREKVHELGITHLLYLGVLSSGGESVTRRWLLGTGITSYMGGAVVSYVLSRVEGDVLASEILPVMYSFGFDPADQRHSPLKQVRFEKQEPKK